MQPDEDRPIKRLYRSRTNKVLGGVCAGLAEYFEVDVAIMRIIFVLLAFVKGLGIILYLVALFVVPYKPEEKTGAETAAQPAPAKKRKSDSSQTVMILFGAILIVIGLIYFLENLDFLPYYWFYEFPFHIGWAIFWPLLLILVGVLYLISISNRQSKIKSAETAGETVTAGPKKRLFRSRRDRKIAGVCGGLGAYFNVDPTIIRVLWVVLTLPTSVILGLVVYIVMALVVPEGDYEEEPRPGTNAGGEA